MTAAEIDTGWEDAAPGGRDAADRTDFVLDLDGYEGPIDVLLTLARQHKLDLTRISILPLAEQYLAFIAAARRVNLEIAAEYLVMAAWLVYLKSRLLLPEDVAEDDEPSGPELAEALSFQLRRLEAMQDTGRRLMGRPRLGQDVFARGDPEGFEVVRHPVFEVSLFDLLSAYGENRVRRTESVLTIEPSELHSTADALERLNRLVDGMVDWQALLSYLPQDIRGGLIFRSAVASTFAASLELARSGRIELRQSSHLGPLLMRGRGAVAAPVRES